MLRTCEAERWDSPRCRSPRTNAGISRGANPRGHALGLSTGQSPRGGALGLTTVKPPKDKHRDYLGPRGRTLGLPSVEPPRPVAGAAGTLHPPPRPHGTPVATLRWSNGTCFPSASPGVPRNGAARLRAPGKLDKTPRGRGRGMWFYAVAALGGRPSVCPQRG